MEYIVQYTENGKQETLVYAHGSDLCNYERAARAMDQLKPAQDPFMVKLVTPEEIELMQSASKLKSKILADFDRIAMSATSTGINGTVNYDVVGDYTEEAIDIALLALAGAGEYPDVGRAVFQVTNNLTVQVCFI